LITWFQSGRDGYEHSPELGCRDVIFVVHGSPVFVADRIDWTELLEFVEAMRHGGVKNAAGSPRRLRGSRAATVWSRSTLVPRFGLAWAMWNTATS
jgi:hypothetical protein